MKYVYSAPLAVERKVGEHKNVIRKLRCKFEGLETHLFSMIDTYANERTYLKIAQE